MAATGDFVQRSPVGGLIMTQVCSQVLERFWNAIIAFDWGGNKDRDLGIRLRVLRVCSGKRSLDCSARASGQGLEG